YFPQCLARHSRDGPAGHQIKEMFIDRVEGKPQLAPTHQVIPEPVFQCVGIADALRPAEAVQPAEPREAPALTARLAELLLDVELFAAEALEPRIETQPRFLAAGEAPQALHRYRKGFFSFAARVRPPAAVHPRGPDRIEMSAVAFLVVEQQGALKQ